MKLLGVPFDHALSMKDAVVDFVSEATWKLAFTDGELGNLYKSQLLSYLKYRTAGIYHACDTVLAALNSFQTKFLSMIGISEEDAMFHFNLAPPSCRRNIAMLGLLHRCALGKSLEHLKHLFNVLKAPRRNTRSGSRMHGRQLVDICNLHSWKLKEELLWV